MYLSLFPHGNSVTSKELQVPMHDLMSDLIDSIYPVSGIITFYYYVRAGCIGAPRLGVQACLERDHAKRVGGRGMNMQFIRDSCLFYIYIYIVFNLLTSLCRAGRLQKWASTVHWPPTFVAVPRPTKMQGSPLHFSWTCFFLAS